LHGILDIINCPPFVTIRINATLYFLDLGDSACTSAITHRVILFSDHEENNKSNDIIYSTHNLKQSDHNEQKRILQLNGVF